MPGGGERSDTERECERAGRCVQRQGCKRFVAPRRCVLWPGEIRRGDDDRCERARSRQRDCRQRCRWLVRLLLLRAARVRGRLIRAVVLGSLAAGHPVSWRSLPPGTCGGGECARREHGDEQGGDGAKHHTDSTRSGPARALQTMERQRRNIVVVTTHLPGHQSPFTRREKPS
jgi:hypothetical protein